MSWMQKQDSFKEKFGTWTRKRTRWSKDLSFKRLFQPLVSLPCQAPSAMADWSSMHSDVLRLITRLVTSVGDHVAFAGVCSSWRSAALEFRPDFPRPLPGLMLPGSHPGSSTRCFFSLSNQKLWKQQLSLPDDHMFFSSLGGWLVAISHFKDIYLLNPFSGGRIALPPATACPSLGDYQLISYKLFLGAAALSSSNTNANPKALTVMIAEGEYKRLAFARPGDEAWTAIEEDPRYCPYNSILFYKGQFYAASSCERGVVVCDIGPHPKVTLVAPFPPRGRTVYKPYLLEWLGDLVLVDRVCCGLDDEHGDENSNRDLAAARGFHRADGGWYKTVYFWVHKLNISEQRWELVVNLGDHAFFLGYNTAYSMSVADYKSCRGNCIYYTDDFQEEQSEDLYGGCDMGVFCMEDGELEPPYKSDADTILPSPMWVTPLPW